MLWRRYRSPGTSENLGCQQSKQNAIPEHGSFHLMALWNKTLRDSQ